MKENRLLQNKRKEKGYLARKVAKDFGFSRATLYRKESGQSPLTEDEARKFADYYDIEESEIKKNYKVER